MSNIHLQLHCPKCGKSIGANDHFCEHCGANLETPIEKNEAVTQRKSRGKEVGIVAAILGLIVCFTVGALVFFFVARPYLAPKDTIILEPARSRISTVPPADLETTAQILKQRWAALGYRNTTFSVSTNDQIVGKIPANLPETDLINRTKAVGLVEFVDFGATPNREGTKVNTDFDYAYFPPVEGKKWHTIMTNHELQTVTVEKDQVGNYVIGFSLTSNGRKILADFTTNHIGGYLGIVLDKVVISCPLINSAITEGQAKIAGNFTYESANDLAIYLRYQPLPIPLK